MGDKKGKALALELMDDLLNEDGDESVVNQGKAKKNEVKGKIPDVEDIEIETFDAHRTEISNKTEISDPQQTLPEVGGDEDRTMRINPTQNHQTAPIAPPDNKVRASVGKFGAFRSSGPASASEAALAQSENLRIAQQRLTEFEQEIERLRLQNEELAAAGETLRRRTDELSASNQRRESDYQHAVSTFAQEKEILINSKEAVQRNFEELRQKNEELELRISTNIQKIRVRERELENRLELVKMESAALIRSKDEMILELKRQSDQLNLELNNYRTKNQELNRLTTDKQEMLRRTVKALRLALSMLEGEEEAPKVPMRKAK